MKIVEIVQDGQTLKGTLCYFLDEVEGDGRNEYGKELEPGEHLSGFFSSEDEARAKAKRLGWTVQE